MASTVVQNAIANANVTDTDKNLTYPDLNFLAGARDIQIETETW